MNRISIAMSLQVALFALLLPIISNGNSLYNAENFQAPAADHRAYRQGDMITVLILEDSEGTTEADRASKTSMDMNAALNQTNRTDKIGAELGYGYAKEGSSGRKGQLKAQISAKVTEVDQRGQLKLEGQQTITVNGKPQIIQLSGWVRPQDIAYNNTVLSARLDQADIKYNGYEVKKKPWYKKIFSLFGVN